MRPRVLAVRLDNAGDVLLQGPALRALSSRARAVALLCSPRGRAAARLLPGVDDVLVFRAPWIDADPGPLTRQAFGELVRTVASRGFDEAVIFTSFHQSPLPTAMALRLAGVPRIAAISVDYPGSLLDVRHLVDEDVHEVERSLSLVRAAGYELPAADDGRLAIRPVRVTAAGANRVVVHPGASVPARAWPAHRHREVVLALRERGWNVSVTGGPNEAVLTARVALGTGATDLGGRTTLSGLASALAGADVVVCGNTGPAHLAAAVGTPVVSLYAPTVPAVRWRPWGVPHVLLGNQQIGCAGCRSKECPILEHPCLGPIRTDDVVAAVESLAREKRATHETGGRLAAVTGGS
jgi:ADP-heptose:LPS heptosyltransferase